MSSLILVVDLGGEEAAPRVLRKFEHHRLRESVIGDRVVKGRKRAIEDTEQPTEEGVPWKRVIATVTRMAVSPDGQWLTTTDDHHRTHVFNLDSIQHHCTLPSFPHPIHALSFDPSAPSTLVLGFANNTIHVYDVEARTFPRWAQALSTALPHRFTHLHDPILGVTFDPAPHADAGKPELLSALFWGANWLARVRLGVPLGQGQTKRRYRDKRRFQDQGGVDIPTEEGQRQLNVKIVTHYRSLLLVDFVAPGELVVVERPLVDVLAKLPPAYFKPKYGAT